MTTRRLFTALALSPAILPAHDEDSNPVLGRTSMIHGATGPFAIAGYRHGGFDLEVIHHAPREVQWSCIIDGLQAATGASLGKLNLTLAPSTVNNVSASFATARPVRLSVFNSPRPSSSRI